MARILRYDGGAHVPEVAAQNLGDQEARDFAVNLSRQFPKAKFAIETTAGREEACPKLRSDETPATPANTKRGGK